jgi:Tfp pilus assembly protein PilP
MPKEQETKLQIQARYAKEVRLRTAERIVELNVAYTYEHEAYLMQREKRKPQSKQKKDPNTDRATEDGKSWKIQREK